MSAAAMVLCCCVMVSLSLGWPSGRVCSGGGRCGSRVVRLGRCGGFVVGGGDCSM
jgi:hypothetical protein